MNESGDGPMESEIVERAGDAPVRRIQVHHEETEGAERSVIFDVQDLSVLLRRASERSAR